MQKKFGYTMNSELIKVIPDTAMLTSKKSYFYGKTMGREKFILIDIYGSFILQLHVTTPPFFLHSRRIGTESGNP